MKEKKSLNMKKLFRRNQIIITVLAVMIATAGYLNYAGKRELEASNREVYGAGMLEISDEDLLMENQNAAMDSGSDYLEEIASWDLELDGIEEAESVASAEPVASSDTASGAADSGTADSGAAVDSGAAAASGADGTGKAAENGGMDGGVQQTGMENPGEAVLTSGMSVSEYIAGVQLSREQVRAKNRETLYSIINNTNIEEAAKQEAIRSMIELTAVAEKENAAETLLMAKGFADPVVSISEGKVDVVINAAGITEPQRAQIEDIVKRKTETGAENIIITLLNLDE